MMVDPGWKNCNPDGGISADPIANFGLCSLVPHHHLLLLTFFFNYYVMFLSMRSFNNAELEMICIGSFHTVSATQLNNHLRIFWKSFGEHNWYLLYSPCWPWRGRSGCPRASWSRLDLFKSICLWKMAYKHVSCQFLMNITGTCCTRHCWACWGRWGCPRASWAPWDQFNSIYL